jgi:chorismate dehydratase
LQLSHKPAPPSPSRLVVGRIPFLVTAPFFHGSLDAADFAFHDGTPAELNALMARDQVHLAPSSSIEYGRHWRDYALLPEACTAGRDQVQSVLLFSRKPWESLSGRLVATAASETSVVLLRLLLVHSQLPCEITTGAEFRAVAKEPGPRRAEPISRRAEPGPRTSQPGPRTSGTGPDDPHLRQADGLLLIGDEALRERVANRWPHVTDLATAWRAWQGLPFVFGLWMVRRQCSDWPELFAWRRELARSLSTFQTDPRAALERWQSKYGLPLPPQELEAYFASLDYSLGEQQQQGLERFFALAHAAGLIPDLPQIRLLAPLTEHPRLRPQ